MPPRPPPSIHRTPVVPSRRVVIPDVTVTASAPKPTAPTLAPPTARPDHVPTGLKNNELRGRLATAYKRAKALEAVLQSAVAALEHGDETSRANVAASIRLLLHDRG